jgi:hypothetical protein
MVINKYEFDKQKRLFLFAPFIFLSYLFKFTSDLII